MKPTDPLDLAADVRDLQVVDANDEDCGIVDDIELDGKPGEKLRIAAILIGPGAYERRLPRWAMRLVRLIAGDRIVRVPWSDVDSIASVVKLTKSAAALGLSRDEERARQMLQWGKRHAAR